MSNPNNSAGRVNVIDDDEDLELSALNVIDLNPMEYRSTNSRKELYQKAMKALEQSEHLVNKNHLQMPQSNRYRDSSSSSSLGTAEDETIDLNSPSKPYNFNPSEITGRSTACITNDENVSVEQILSESHCSHVRALADELKEFKIRESYGGEQFARTADVSMTSTKSFRSSMSKPDDWGAADQSNIDVSGMFMPSDRVKDFLKNEEERWVKECATLPEIDANSEPKGNETKNQYDLSDFSRCRFANQSACESNASVGHFFNKRSYDVREMFPNVSPVKYGRPAALLDSLNTTKDSLVMEDEIESTASSMAQQNKTHAKNGTASKSESLISISAIESFYQKCSSADSPQTISNNLLKLKSAIPVKKKASSQSPPEIAYVTESLPLKSQNSNSNVNVIKVEKFYGDVSALRNLQSSAHQLANKSTFLTPSRQHIKKNYFYGNKENQEVCKDYSEENTWQQNLHSDTLSMSGILLSSSEIQEATPKSSLEWDILNSNISESTDDESNEPPQPNDMCNDSESRLEFAGNKTPINSEDLEITPTNSPIRRKRTRSKDKTITPTTQVSPVRKNKLDVLYNPKHRLYSPSHAATVGKKTLDVLYNPKHRLLTPSTSPHSSKSHTKSTVTSPHSSQIESNSKSPKLLTQCNSQFSSVNDLREFSVKSSQSVISWPSQKLRTASVKQFTIKNIGGKKLTMKIEVVGPGFQLSPSEPFQLIALQAQECRTISVTFCPTILGSAVGKLNFCHAKDSADRHARKIIPLFGYGGHTVLEVQGVSQGVVGYPFLQLGTTGDLLNMQLNGTFSIYNKGPLKGVAIIRIKSDTKKPTGGGASTLLKITPSKSVIDPDGIIQIEVAYRPRKNDVRKLLRQEGNVLGVGTLEVFMADEPSRQRILGLISKFATNSSDVYLLDDLFRGIQTDVVESFKDFNETEDMIAELFNKMKSTEVILTVKRSTMDQTIESEHDFFLSDTNESMFFHTLVSDEFAMPEIPSNRNGTSNICAPSTTSLTSTIVDAPHVRSHRVLARSTEEWFVQPNAITLNPCIVDRSTCKIEIYSNSLSRQIFEIDSNYRNVFVIEPECGVINPGLFTTVSITIRKVKLPSEAIYIRIRVDKKQEIDVPVTIDKSEI